MTNSIATKSKLEFSDISEASNSISNLSKVECIPGVINFNSRGKVPIIYLLVPMG